MTDKIGTLPNGAPQYFPRILRGVYDQKQRGPDGITDAQRAIDPDPKRWGTPEGLATDDSKDTNI